MSVESFYNRLIAIIQVLRVWNPCVLVAAYHRKIRGLVTQARLKEDYLPLFAAVLLEALGLIVLLVALGGLFIEPRAALVVIPVLAGFYAINKYQDIFGSPRVHTAAVWWFVLITSLITGLFPAAQSTTLVPTLGVSNLQGLLLRGVGIIGIWIAMTRLVPFDAVRLGTRLTENQSRPELPRPVALNVVPYPYHPLAWLAGIYVVASLGLLSLVVQLPVTAVGSGGVIVSLLPMLLGIVYIVRMVTDYVVWRGVEQ